MKVIILTEGSKKIGIGHISRCSSIYQAFEMFNVPVEFIVNADETADQILNGFNYSILNWIENENELFKILNPDDIVLVDSYLADQELYEKISKHSSILLSIDDNKRLKYAEGFVINGTIMADTLNYPNIEEISYLLGSEYIPLRCDFWDCDVVDIKPTIKNILVTMGGSDLRNLTPSILDLLDKNYPNLNKKVIIGNAFEDADYLNYRNTEFIYSPNAKGMKEAMLSSDLVISASGQTLYELSRVGLPTIAVGVADNQINNIKNWQKQGFIEFAGFWNDKNLLNNILEKIKFLMSYEIRLKNKNNGISAVDGKGAIRIAKTALNSFYKSNSKLRKIKLEDCLKIYEISNDDDVRKYSFNSEKIKLEDHKVWFNNILKDDSTEFLVLEYGNDLIGQLRFDFDEEYPVISISLNKKYRGLGLSKVLLSKGLNHIKNYDKVIAYIKKENKVSISFFESMGFEAVDEVKIKNNDVLKYIYQLGD